MRKAARRSTTTETNCPAAAMAKLIGLNFELGFDFSEREHSKEEGDKEKLVFELASKDALYNAELATRALALAPVKSLPGAIAKIIASYHILEDAVLNEDLDEYDGNRTVHLTRWLLEDAMNFIEADTGITVESVGLADLYNSRLLPQKRIKDALELRDHDLAKTAVQK
jgi:hypothetical protein